MPSNAFSHRISQRRRALSLSQQDVADRMRDAGNGVSHQTVWKWEAGETVPRRTKLPALAAALVLAQETVMAWWLGTDVDDLPTPAGSPWEGLFDELSEDARVAIERIVALDRAARAARGTRPSG